MNSLQAAEKLVGELRLHLYTLIEENDDLVKDEVVQTSQKLDKALNWYSKLALNNDLIQTG